MQNSAVEQWPARWAHNPKVVGSNPASATNFKFNNYEQINFTNAIRRSKLNCN